ncbi:ParB/RepB/Spo0J family partition protein [Patescibacteria group bacterium]|nr:ParB/RepB/Spo0J family partition protein [Patescibacteria group bacterium]MBU1663351.1 ParB/RepB/Spo0J family partition protein [Patescibacteria group bacterium]MBU1934068.1 ParB/RepB/Spo0J family partition protein [Patescibacteria group bacterium]
MVNNSLGRGLSSLIPQKVNKVAATLAGDAVINVASEADRGRVLQLKPEQVGLNPMQPRKNFNEHQLNELIESIRQYGVIQPLIVTQKNGKFELIAGERRLRAVKVLGLAVVPAIVRQADEQEQLELALVENLQRENLNSIEAALAYRKLIDEFNLSQEELAVKVGKSRPVITNTLRFLNLPEEIQQALIQGKITEGHAKIIIGLESQAKQMALYKKILLNKMNVDQSLKETRIMGGTKRARIKINYADKDKEFAFRQFFGTKAEVKRKGKGGEVIIYFYSDEELGEMVAKIKK